MWRLFARLSLCRDGPDTPVVHVHWKPSQLAIAHVLSVLLMHIEGCRDGSSKNHRSTGVQNPQHIHLHLHSFEVYA